MADHLALCAEGTDELKDEENEDDPFEEADRLGLAAEAASLAHDAVARGGFEGTVDCNSPASTSGRTHHLSATQARLPC